MSARNVRLRRHGLPTEVLDNLAPPFFVEVGDFHSCSSAGGIDELRDSK
jgi:hypothetical protein